MRRLLLAVIAISTLGLAAPDAWAVANNSYPSSGPSLFCDGHPWIDVRCNGAVGNDSTDDTTAITTTISQAEAASVPIMFSAGTYKVTGGLTIDTNSMAAGGIHIISHNAIIDSVSYGGGPTLQLKLSGGTTGSPATDVNSYIEGPLTVKASYAGYAVVLGQANFADIFKGLHVDHLTVTNANTGGSAGGVQVNYVVGGNLTIDATTSGGSSGTGAIALEQAQDTTLGGTGSAAGTSAPSLLIEQGTSTGDVISGFNYGTTSATCLSISSTLAKANVFVAPVFGCTTGVNASLAGAGNVLLSPTFNDTNRGPISAGVTIVAQGGFNRYLAPAASSYTPVGADAGTMLSSANATGGSAGWASGSLPVTLPNPATVGVGWSMGFMTDGGKAIGLTPSSGAILAGGQSLSSMLLGPGNYQWVTLTSDGTNMRARSGSVATMVYNGAAPPGVPSRWEYPAGPGYSATEADNANVISSSSSSAGLTVTLPSTTAIVAGWTVGVAADAKPIIINVNGVSGGIIYFSDATVTTFTIAAGAGRQIDWIQFDGANFNSVTGSLTVNGVVPPASPLLGSDGTAFTDVSPGTTMTLVGGALNAKSTTVNSQTCTPGSSCTITVPGTLIDATATGTTNYALTPIGSVPATPYDGEEFSFIVPNTTVTQPTIASIVGMTGGPWNIVLSDGYTFASSLDLVKNQRITIIYNLSAADWQLETPSSAVGNSANVPIAANGGMYKLEAGSATVLDLDNSISGGGVTQWNTTTGSYRVLPLGPTGAITQSLFNGTARVNGNANQSLAHSTLYGVFLEPGSSHSPYVGTMSFYAFNGGPFYIINSTAGYLDIPALYVLSNSGVPDNTRVFLGLVWVGTSNTIAPIITGNTYPVLGNYTYTHSAMERWHFGYQTTKVNNTGLTATSQTNLATPQIQTVTEGLSDSPHFSVTGEAGCGSTGGFVVVWLGVTQTFYNGATGTVFTPDFEMTVPPDNFLLAGTASLVPFHIEWESAPGISYNVAQLYYEVSGGATCSINASMLGDLPQ